MTNTIVTTNPTNGKILKRYPLMSDFEAMQAVEQCDKAFQSWKLTSLKERAKQIQKIGKELAKNKQKLAKMMTQEMGKLMSQSEQEVDLCVAICEWTAANGPEVLASEERVIDEETKGIITYAPLGIVYGIQPWNYPSYQVIRYSIANLMAGNGVLLKHASNVTGTGKLLEQIYLKSGLPKHLFKAIRVSHEQSDMVLKNDKVRGITLTGSSAAGRNIAEKAGAVLKKTVLELGSNDAYIVLADANIKKAVEICVQGRIYNNGETCIAAKRFVVVDKIYDKFRTAFTKAMQDITTGDPMSDDVEMGPMARADLRDTLHSQVTESVEMGAAILCGGEVPEGEGCFYPATVLDNVSPGQPAYEDELFGPVASLIRVKDTDDAMRIANDSRFGLGGGIISKNAKKAQELAEQHFDTGMVFINGFGTAAPNMPFGGIKDSGFGREHGGFGIREFVNVKSLIVSKN